MANKIHMNTPRSRGKAPIKLLSKIASTTNPKHFHPFWMSCICPLQYHAKRWQRLKWQEWAHVGIHLGTSLVHARNVSLMLGLKMGLVSPQFPLLLRCGGPFFCIQKSSMMIGVAFVKDEVICDVFCVVGIESGEAPLEEFHHRDSLHINTDHVKLIGHTCKMFHSC